MNTRFHPTPWDKFRSAVAAIALLAAAMTGWSQSTPPPEDKKSEPPSPPPIEQVAPAPVTPTTADAPAAAATAEAPDAPKAMEPAAGEPQLRELGTNSDEATPAAKDESGKKGRASRHKEGPPFGNHHVGKDATEFEAVSVFGSTTVDGRVEKQAVSVMGDTTVNGRVDGEAVSVMGKTVVNGSVGSEAVAVLGDMVLGPKAVVEGNVTVVLGKLVRAEGAEVKGTVNEISGFGNFGDFAWLRAWITKCALFGRPLWIGENLGWAWMIAGGFLVFYVLLGLIFPSGINRCATVLEERPGSTFLAALLTALLTPIVIILLAVTGIGIALIPFVVAGLLLGTLFGKAAVLGWFGRRVTGVFGEGPMRHAAVSVFVGGLIVMVLYMIPLLGFLLFKAFGVLGLGMVVYALVLQSRRNRPAPLPRPAAPAPAAAAAVAAVVAPVAEPAAPEGTAPVVESAPVAPAAVPASYSPPLITADSFPRAGFWIRLAAALLDLVLVTIALVVISKIIPVIHPNGLLFWYAVYCAIMWGTKATTVGGVICGLKVVRLDGRRIDWGVAIVRTLGGFLSLAVAGLGFIWVAFDEDRQSWHDKIAGTTIVKVPRGTPLI